MPADLPDLDWTERDQRAVDTARILAADAVQKVGNGHPGTAMSLAPAAYTLFQKVMRHDPADPEWVGRDRFVLSVGHSSLTLYTQLYLAGFGLQLDDLKAFRTAGSKTPGHPEYGHTAGVETTTGPLGQVKMSPDRASDPCFGTKRFNGLCPYRRARLPRKTTQPVRRGATMSISFAGFLLPLLILAGTLWLACVVLGLHGLLLGRMPGRWLQRHVRQPRLWGAGALLVACGGFEHPSLTVVGIGLVILGHVVKPTS